MVMDTNGGLLHLLLADGTFRAVSLTDSSSQPALGDGNVERFIMASNGDVFAANGLGVVMWDGTAWTTVASVSSTDGGTEALSMIEVPVLCMLPSKAWASCATIPPPPAPSQRGVQPTRSIPTASRTWPSPAINFCWGPPITVLHVLTMLRASGSQRGPRPTGYRATPDRGRARWPNVVHPRREDLHSYNTTNGVFSTTYALATLGLANLGPRSPSGLPAAALHRPRRSAGRRREREPDSPLSQPVTVH